MLVLLLQSYFSESNFEYNKQIQVVNHHLKEGDYRNALTETNAIAHKSIFTNNDVSRLQRSLTIKVNSKLFDFNYTPRTLGDYVIQSVAYLHRKNYSQALAFSQTSLQEKPFSDTLIKIYELVAVKSPVNWQTSKQIKQTHSINKIRLNEALNLLDLMKRKEKTLL